MKMPADEILIRPLSPDDVQAYRALRLRGIDESPQAFFTSYQAESSVSRARMQQRLIQTRFQMVFGAFRNGWLVGMAAFKREPIAVVRDRATIWGVYVAPEARGKNVAKDLMLQALEHARAHPELRVVSLSVSGSNISAKMLYLRLGFVPPPEAGAAGAHDHLVYFLTPP
ncbi:MAG: GNAT family N-acetyltransferase [Pseudomonadota bacterium]